MSDLNNQINRVVEAFVAEITELARKAALEALEHALQQAGKGRRATGGGKTKAAKKKAPAKKAPAKKAAKKNAKKKAAKKK